MKTIKLRLKNEKNFLVTIAIACLILGITTLPFLILEFLWLLDHATFCDELKSAFNVLDNSLANQHLRIFMSTLI